jgi:hypothetical protein
MSRKSAITRKLKSNDSQGGAVGSPLTPTQPATPTQPVGEAAQLSKEEFNGELLAYLQRQPDQEQAWADLAAFLQTMSEESAQALGTLLTVFLRTSRIAIATRAMRDKPMAEWVFWAAARVMSMVAPTSKFSQNILKLRTPSPRAMGAYFGHAYAWESQQLEYLLEYCEKFKLDAHLMAGLTDLPVAVLRKAESVAGHRFKDTREFWRGFADGLKRGTLLRNDERLAISGETDRLNILLTLIENRIEIEKHRTTEPKWRMEDLHNFLVQKIGSNLTGDQKRLEKICSDIRLKLGSPGRPRTRSSPRPATVR